MRIRVMVFARLRELLGEPQRTIELGQAECVADAWEALVRVRPALREERVSTRAARNGQLVPFDSPLADGDELAFLPPVGGG